MVDERAELEHLFGEATRCGRSYVLLVTCALTAFDVINGGMARLLASIRDQYVADPLAMSVLALFEYFDLCNDRNAGVRCVAGAPSIGIRLALRLPLGAPGDFPPGIRQRADGSRAGTVALESVDSAAFFNAWADKGLEGIVSKTATSLYRSGRTNSWLKTKCFVESSFVVVGTDRDRKTGALRALLAHPNSDGLRYAGAAFIALSRDARTEFLAKVERRRDEASDEPGRTWHLGNIGLTMWRNSRPARGAPSHTPEASCPQALRCLSCSRRSGKSTFGYAPTSQPTPIPMR